MTEETDISRISRLAEAVRKAKSGDICFHVEVSGENDELDILADEIRQMAESLHDTIVGRKAAEDARRDYEERFRRLEVNIPGMVYTFVQHPDGNVSFSYVNEASRQLFDISPEDLTGNASLLISLIHPDDREKFVSSVKRSAETQQPWREVLRHIVNGEVRWYDCMSRPELQANGDVLWDGIMLEITAQKRFEDALRESELRYREVFENTSDCLFLLDVTVDGRFKFAGFNPAEEKAVGFLSAKTSGKFVEEVIPEALARQVIANYRRCVLFGTIINYEEKLDLPVGVRYFQTVLIPVRNAVGDIYRIIGISRDTTESRRVEEALRQAKLVVEKSPVVLFRWRAAEGWPVEMVSGNVIRYGYTPEELLSGAVPFSSIVYSEDVERVAAEVQEYSRSGVESFQQEYRIVTKEGDVCWVDDRTVVERDDEGNVSHYQGIVIDITDRKRTESVIAARIRLLQFAETHTLDELLEATLNEVEELTGSCIG
ncbi:MAG: PAS domain-containing protein, partial [Geobacteraceae bacterium]|nr:PAS domain-containing protein [Geobacteraceae bacterium]